MWKPIVIELTGLPWSWKTTVLSDIRKQNLLSENFFICDENSNISKSYNQKKLLNKMFFRGLNLLKYPSLHYKFVMLSLENKNKYFACFNKFSLYLYFFDKIYSSSNYNYIVFDQFLLQYIFRSLSFGSLEEETIVRKISKLKKDFFIYPIHFDTSIDVHKKRVKERKEKWEKGNPNDINKKKSNDNPDKRYISKHITQKYCELTNKPYLEVDGDASIEEKTKQVMKHIEYILEITGNNE